MLPGNYQTYAVKAGPLPPHLRDKIDLGIIRYDREFSVGDTVPINGKKGLVKEINHPDSGRNPPPVLYKTFNREPTPPTEIYVELID